MSLPGYVISCDRCGVSGGSTLLLEPCAYGFPDERTLPIDIALGCCARCNQIVPVEVIANLQEVRSSADRIVEQLRTLQPKGVFRLFPFLLGSIRFEIAQLQRDLSDLQLRVEFLSSRQSPPRCLRCGCHEIARIPLEAPGQHSRKKLDFIHPGCGGSLWAEVSPMRFHLRNRASQMFNPEGLPLSRRC